jgi:urocanate hydratase
MQQSQAMFNHSELDNNDRDHVSDKGASSGTQMGQVRVEEGNQGLTGLAIEANQTGVTESPCVPDRGSSQVSAHIPMDAHCPEGLSANPVRQTRDDKPTIQANLYRRG